MTRRRTATVTFELLALPLWSVKLRCSSAAQAPIAHGNKTDFCDARSFYQGSATPQSTSTSNPLKC